MYDVLRDIATKDFKITGNLSIYESLSHRFRRHENRPFHFFHVLYEGINFAELKARR